MNDPHKTIAASFAPLASVIIWTGNTLVAKAAAVVMEPASIAFYRWALAFLILALILGRSVWRQRAAYVRYWWKLALLGALGMATFQGLTYEAARTTSAVNMGVILALLPLVSTILSAKFASESIGGRRILGAAISLCGISVLMTNGDISSLLERGVRIGDILMTCAVFANALYGILLKRWPMPISIWQQMLGQIAFGLLVLAPFWLARPISPIDSTNVLLILYAGIPASLGAPFFWIVGIKRLGAARSAQFMNLLPLFVALMTWALLDEPLHYYQALGGSIALLGVVVGLKPPKTRRQTELPPPL